MKRLLLLALVLASCSRGSDTDALVEACSKDYREQYPNNTVSSFRAATSVVDDPGGRRTLLVGATVRDEFTAGTAYRDILCIEKKGVVIAVQR